MSLQEELERLQQKANQLKKVASAAASKRLEQADKALGEVKTSIKKIPSALENTWEDTKEFLTSEEAASVVKVATKANKTATQLHSSIESIKKLHKTINAFADTTLAEDGKESDKYKRYIKMSEGVQSILKEVGKLKGNVDKLAKIENSHLTKQIKDKAALLEKINRVLKWAEYLADDAPVQNFINNPDDYKAGKAWATHVGKGFTLIGDTIEAIPVPDGPLKDVIKYFSGVAKTAPKLIDAYIGALDMKFDRIEKEAGFSLTGGNKHHITDGNERLYEGAFAFIYANCYYDKTGLKALLEAEKDLLMDADLTAAYRLDQLKKKIIALQVADESNEAYAEWLTLLEDNRATILHLGANER